VVVVRLHGPWRQGVFRGSMVGAAAEAGPLLQTGSDGGILNECTV
jgi:hypothetical protein